MRRRRNVKATVIFLATFILLFFILFSEKREFKNGGVYTFEKKNYSEELHTAVITFA
jgi:hypothetical protein